ncbi:MAG: hypothetical protein J4G15_16070 [Alphaproteobacteria bacterium]|nr:hypothetical protein [Alphaproteobacteria bacterium]
MPESVRTRNRSGIERINACRKGEFGALSNGVALRDIAGSFGGGSDVQDRPGKTMETGWSRTAQRISQQARMSGNLSIGTVVSVIS